MKKLMLIAVMFTVVGCSSKAQNHELTKGQQAVVLLKYQKAITDQQKLNQDVASYNEILKSTIKEAGYPDLCLDDKATECSRVTPNVDTESVTVIVVPKSPPKKK